ncbi:Hypothetical protein HVR_LOCUS863 [uncultured virus]|nr:Hypothetical protein HVR_LOCUS863 [uncultured virus]
MDQLSRILNSNGNNAIVDASKYTEEELYSILKSNHIIRKEIVQCRVERSFNLESLKDIDSLVKEYYYIKYSGGTRNMSDLLFFDKKDMKIVEQHGCTTSYTVTFGKDVEAYIIEEPYYDKCIEMLAEKMEKFGIQYKSEEILNLLIDELMNENISIRNASENDILRLLALVESEYVN